MNLEEFESLYKSDIKNSEHIFERWDKEKRIDELLNTPIAPGVVLSDMIIGDRGLDQIKPELKEAFELGKGQSADSYSEIREILYEQIDKGADSTKGFINNMLGNLGELEFKKEAERNGLDVILAPTRTQEGWDAKFIFDSGPEYVQVKLYSNPDDVIQKIKEVNEKIVDEKIFDGKELVQKIDFAVPENIKSEVESRVIELGLDTKIHSISMTNAEGRDIVELGLGFSMDLSEALENFFSEMLGSSITATALHGLVNGFLLYKGAKDFEEFMDDTLEQSVISSGAISAGLGTEALITEISTLGGPALMVLVLGSTITTRAILKRFANRQSYTDWLKVQNSHLDNLILQFNQ